MYCIVSAHYLVSYLYFNVIIFYSFVVCLIVKLIALDGGQGQLQLKL